MRRNPRPALLWLLAAACFGVLAAPKSPQASLTTYIHQVVGGAPSGSTASGNPVLVAGMDPSGNARTFRVDATGRPDGSSYYHTQTNVTLAVAKSGSGVLRGFLYNPGTTSGINIYDSNGTATSQIFNTTTASPGYATFVPFGPYGVRFTNGLTISTTGSGAAEVVVIFD